MVLDATSGMRRCELADVRRDLLDLDAGTLAIEVTRVVDGRVIESDGKTENAQHMLALDPFTLAALKGARRAARPGAARARAGVSGSRRAVLLGRTAGLPNPDTTTRRFKKPAAAAGLPEIDLHAVRHSYATAGRDAKINWKALSHRIGHSDVAFTMKRYVQTDLEADRQVANTLAELIIGGSLASTAVASLANPLANYMQKALSLFEKGPLALVAGEGFEPATSGL